MSVRDEVEVNIGSSDEHRRRLGGGGGLRAGTDWAGEIPGGNSGGGGGALTRIGQRPFFFVSVHRFMLVPSIDSDE